MRFKSFSFISVLAPLALASVAATAHPTENDSMARVPTGVSLEVQIDINIKPQTNRLYIQDGVVLDSPDQATSQSPLCSLDYSSSASDRVLRAGRTMYFTDYVRYEGVWAGQFGDIPSNLRDRLITVRPVSSLPGMSSLICFSQSSSVANYHAITIQELRATLKGVVTLGAFPAPTDF